MTNILQGFRHTLLNPTKNPVGLFDFDEWLIIYENNVTALLC